MPRTHQKTQDWLNEAVTKSSCGRVEYQAAHVAFTGVLNRLAAQVAGELHLLDESELEERIAPVEEHNVDLISRFEEMRQKLKAAQRQIGNIQDEGRRLFRNLDDAERCEAEFREKAEEAGYTV